MNVKNLIVYMAFMLPLAGWAQKKDSARPEFRAAWISTVENIDWPSRKGLPTEVQKAEFIRLLDMHHKNGLNAVVVQVRPVADAFYASRFEPWSEYLSGVQGKAPDPFYDPMKFMIDECHKRNMEFHAWINPYRAVFNPARSSIHSSHPTKTNPEWFITYGDAKNGIKKYFDPGNPEARNFLSKVVEDIVTRYDIDGLHMDDYFYPYPVWGVAFPDSRSYNKYNRGLTLEDWRRSNVDSAIVDIHRIIQKNKPWVKFGISPFGVWRNASQDPNGSNTQAGLTNYDHLYADILLWLQKGWIDYVVPQLYWEIGHKLADYTTLIDWWGRNTYGRDCYIGIGIYRAGSNAAWKDPNQLPMQLDLCRETPNINGQVYFNSKTFFKNPLGWNDTLQNNYYKERVPTPRMEWLPARPEVK